MHDAIEAARKFRLKRTSISKNNRKFLPFLFLINSAGFPEKIPIGEFSGSLTISSSPLPAVMSDSPSELFFYFLFASNVAVENSSGRSHGE
ncbi:MULTISPECIES: hypothetical protein [Burkholderia]|uniref:hypothetical protein n=1 Tax=Burkholderia TaxID=32008 RepID=UPI00126A6138|nr:MULTISPECIES: hypothetical protein [Burkholderia]